MCAVHHHGDAREGCPGESLQPALCASARLDATRRRHPLPLALCPHPRARLRAGPVAERPRRAGAQRWWKQEPAVRQRTWTQGPRPRAERQHG